LESELPQAAQIVKIDVDENTDAASEFQVNGIPHTFMFNDGELVSERVGYVDTKGLISWIKSRD
ncbi:MAG: thioredoxin family protein, partial [Planctomycetota bacterium]